MPITNSQITGSLEQIVITDGNGNITDITLSNSVSAANGVFTNLTVTNVATIPTANVSALNVSSAANLGSNSNITITGGSSGDVLLSNGSGGLYWANAANAFVANRIVDGTSNVQVYPNGNVAFGINTDPNVMVVHSGGITVDGANIVGNLTVGGYTDLGPNSNVRIEGGNFGYFLTTDGNGGLYWTDPCTCGGGGGGSSGVTQIIAGNGVTISPGSGVGVVTINAGVTNPQAQFQWIATTTGIGQSFVNAGLDAFADGTYASVYINGVLQQPQYYTIVGTTLTFLIKINSGDVIQVGPTGAGGGGGGTGGGSVTSVGTTTTGGALGFSLTGGTITTSGTVALNVPTANVLLTNLGIPNITNVANYPALNSNGNTYLNGNGQWVNIAVPTGNIANTNYNGNGQQVLAGNGTWIQNSTPPGGTNGQLQYNNSGTFAGANVTWNSATNTLNVTGNVIATGTVNGSIINIRETYSALNAGILIDLSLGSWFSKTITGPTTLSVAGSPTAPLVGSFIIEITNGGSNVTWNLPGLQWPNGGTPVLTNPGTDVLGFYTYNGGASWKGFVLGVNMV